MKYLNELVRNSMSGDNMTVHEYMDLPYNIIVRRIKDESGEYFFATVQELDGCMSDGATIEELYKYTRSYGGVD